MLAQGEVEVLRDGVPVGSLSFRPAVLEGVLVEPVPDPARDPDPDPHPWEVAQVFAAASLVFAHFAGGLEDAELRDAFRAAADTAGERAVQGLDAKG